jgi:hypothetical protein
VVEFGAVVGLVAVLEGEAGFCPRAGIEMHMIMPSVRTRSVPPSRGPIMSCWTPTNGEQFPTTGTASGSATADAQVDIYPAMAYVVLCGSANHAPDRIVGPFESRDEADRYAEGQAGAPKRYAVVEPLTSPSN